MKIGDYGVRDPGLQGDAVLPGINREPLAVPLLHLDLIQSPDRPCDGHEEDLAMDGESCFLAGLMVQLEEEATQLTELPAFRREPEEGREHDQVAFGRRDRRLRGPGLPRRACFKSRTRSPILSKLRSDSSDL